MDAAACSMDGCTAQEGGLPAAPTRLIGLSAQLIEVGRKELEGNGKSHGLGACFSLVTIVIGSADFGYSPEPGVQRVARPTDDNRCLAYTPVSSAVSN